MFRTGQEVVVRPVETRSPGDCAINSLAGQRGKITNYYSISLYGGQTVYIYSVLIDKLDKEIALHEDEIKAY